MDGSQNRFPSNVARRNNLSTLVSRSMIDRVEFKIKV